MMIYITPFYIITLSKSLSRNWWEFLKNTILQFSLSIADFLKKNNHETGSLMKQFLDRWETNILQKKNPFSSENENNQCIIET